MLLFLHIIYLFNINLLNFFLYKNVKPVRMGNLYLIFCHILHIKCMVLCVWGLNSNHVKILPWCHLFHSHFFSFFLSFFFVKAGVSLVALGQNMVSFSFFLFWWIKLLYQNHIYLFMFCLQLLSCYNNITEFF